MLPVQTAKARAYAAFTVIRPLVLSAAAVAGGAFGAYQLWNEPWHHNALVWIVAWTVALFGVVGLYKEVTYRVRLHRWLQKEDPEEVWDEEPELREMVQWLPPWYRQRFLARRQAVRSWTGKRSRPPGRSTNRS